MIFLLPPMFIIGYLIGLNLPLLIQLIIYIMGCACVFNSDRFRQAELGQLVYLAAAAMFFFGASSGNMVYLYAHAHDPATMKLVRSIVHSFMP